MTATEHALEDLTPHQLVAEIRQISAQYKSEVNTKRRTWPASVRERVLALGRQGVNSYRIAELTEVPYNTVLHWFGRSKSKSKTSSPKSRASQTQADEGRFLPVVSVARDGERSRVEQAAPPMVEPTMVVPPTVVGLTVVLPNGLEVRGLSSLAQVAELHRLMGGQP